MSQITENLVFQLESLLQDLHNDFFSDPKNLIHKLETLIFDYPLSSSPEILSKITSLLIFDSKTNLFKYFRLKISEKDRISSNFRKNLIDFLRKYLKTYPKSLSFQAISLIKTHCFSLFQTDISSPVKEASLGPIIAICKLFPKDQIKPCIYPEKLIEILLKNLRDLKHSSGVKSRIWQLSGLLCEIFPRELDNYKLEVSEVCFSELSAQISLKSKPELIVIEGLLKALSSLLKENYLTFKQLTELFGYLKCLITPIADVHSYKVLRNALKVLCEHCGLFSSMILQDSLSLLSLITGLFSLTNRKVRESAGEMLESLIKLLVSILDPSQDLHKALFKEIFVKIQNFFENSDLILICSGIRALGHLSRSVRLFLSERKVRDLFTQMLEFSSVKVLKPLESLAENSTDEKDPLDSFKTILFLQKQVFSFLNAFASLVANISALTEFEINRLFSLCLLSVKLHRKFLNSYKPQLYEAIVGLFLNFYQHHHSIFVPFSRRFFNNGLFETLKIPENVILAGEDYHNSLKDTCDLWLGLFSRDFLWTKSARNLFISCFFQGIVKKKPICQITRIISNICIELCFFLMKY